MKQVYWIDSFPLSSFRAPFRLCQDIVLMKAEVAELLLASIIVNLAGKKDMDVDLYKLISLQVVSLFNFCLFTVVFMVVLLHFEIGISFLSVMCTVGPIGSFR